MTAVAQRMTPQSSFDRANWPPSLARVVAAGLLLALAGALWSLGGIWRLAAWLLALDVAVQLLPWRHPRSARSAVSIWSEALLYLAAPGVLVVAAAVSRQSWVTRLPGAQWWPIAAAVGAALVWISGIPLRALLRGDLAFLAGAVSRPHKFARCVSIAAAPPGEEFLFRAPLLAAAGPAAAPLGLLTAAAFVARHHLPPGLHERTTARVLLIRIAGATALTVLTLASRSIYPALLAHYLNNVPPFLLELGRRTDDRSRLALASR